MHLSAIQYVAIIAIIGAAVILKIFVLPRLLRVLLGVKKCFPKNWRDRVELRYEKLPTSVWMFAWFKLRLDPMFRELPIFLKEIPPIHTALDLGCGYGVAGSALLEWFPDLRLHAIDPRSKRVRMAALAMGNRAAVFQARAPDFESPTLPAHFDAVFVLDVLHYLSDIDLALTLQRIHSRLQPAGRLVLRVPVPPAGIGSPLWNLDKIRRKITGEFAEYRSAKQMAPIILNAGFTIERAQISGSEKRELHWFIAHKAANGKSAAQQ